MSEAIKTGVYQSTCGDFAGAAILVIDVSTPDEAEFCYLTIYNPESKESHELTEYDWKEMLEIDGLQWQQEIPEAIKDEFLFKKSFASIPGLT
ncbi:hypothetical protein THMIRHAS_13290 [Thiosulfatimonas sediminis]|uniref:Uncharacterized protein n=1 Tax=Thiosulfatimonas sediminis TaxID=2675054 RepID=A0A6F8PV36_9GAMM|nr:hypothetical protein [Thiosulfatimonas sediminis]BBP45956.1 hypothetical protein THMIRHAS_13290 [Thiosulfatimonas sediminis]